MDTLAYAKKLIEIKIYIKDVNNELESKINNLEIRMVKWFSTLLIGIVINILVLFLAILKFMH